MARTRIEPLTDSEAQEILDIGTDGILVGGMALSFWARLFGVTPPSALQAGVTRDIDFFGSSRLAREFFLQLQQSLVPPATVEILYATIDDQTPNAAKILIRNFHDRDEAVEIDFLDKLFGYNVAAENRLKHRALKVTVGTATITVMHPMDCLVTRVRNLNGLKEGAEAVAQCRLAITVTREYLLSKCQHRDSQREALRAVEQIGVLAASISGVRAFIKSRLDILRAVPATKFQSQKFQKKRWPQITKHVSAKRKRYIRRVKRQT